MIKKVFKCLLRVCLPASELKDFSMSEKWVWGEEDEGSLQIDAAQEEDIEDLFGNEEDQVDEEEGENLFGDNLERFSIYASWTTSIVRGQRRA